ncbi:hypothetical protein F5Y04DRAFT_283251 [Hypomontagnella monticulosa]|nr:hypothetical protein F5Y04DRAFT_283251 [Hypomontagnella monticulosa]
MDIKTRFLIISDIHGEDVPAISQIPAVDVAIHSGDLTKESHIEEFKNAVSFLKTTNTLLKLVMAGNYDFTIDTSTFKKKVAENQALELELGMM